MSLVAVEVATVWTGPEASRPVDAPAVADVPDVAAWTSSMDDATRRGLHGRTLTQAVRGEEVVALGPPADGWLEVVLPWQPSRSDPRGYRGWMRSSHLGDPRPGAPVPDLTAADGADPAERLIATAATMLGSRYLWGGTSRWGVDCSGLVHLAHRALGVRVPRDASDQQPVASPVDLDAAGGGDLWFFARPGGSITHVGLVTNEPGAERRMLHAPEGGGLVEDAPMAPQRAESLVAAGRLLSVG